MSTVCFGWIIERKYGCINMCICKGKNNNSVRWFWIFLLWCYTKTSSKLVSLKFSCDVSMDLLYSGTLKIYQMGLLALHDFVTSCISYLKNNSSRSHVYLLNMDRFPYIKQSPLLLLAPITPKKKSWNIRKPCAWWLKQVFQSAHFCLTAYISSWTTSATSCFP